MLCSFKYRGDLENLEELASLQSQVEEVRLQNELGKQIFCDNIKKSLNQLLIEQKNTSEILTKTFTETSIENNKSLQNLNKKILEMLNDNGSIDRY